MVSLVGKASVSPLRPRCVLANGVATVFSAPARIMMKNECLVASEIFKRQILLIIRRTNTQKLKPNYKGSMEFRTRD